MVKKSGFAYELENVYICYGKRTNTGAIASTQHEQQGKCCQ